jgi:outer membrane receptor protein involved in Fe transport
LRLNTNGYARGQVLDVDPTFGAGGGFFENHGYFVMNGGFSVRTFRGVEVYGQLNNFTDQRYEEAFGFPAYRLNFMTGIRLRFPGERGGTNHP